MIQGISEFAFVEPSKGTPKAVVVSFHGLGHCSEKKSLEIDELELSYNGAITVFPYYGPWSWMNREARTHVDTIIDRVYEHFHLDESVPLILRGGSMGGHAALNYACYSKKAPVALAANCPVTDPLYHSTERTDLPRTFQLAYGMGPQSLMDAFRENSPIENVDILPRIPYLIVHGTADTAVSKQAHSDPLVEKMRSAGHDVTYIEPPNMSHCTFNDFSVYRRYQDFVLGFFK